MISELYVPRERLEDFMEAVAEDFARTGVDVIYGTVRLIERDDESFLAWAREPWACVIFNLHTEHTRAGIERTADAFRRLIDLTIARGGSYFLTYHRWARRDQVEACYPQFREFLARKREHDPDARLPERLVPPPCGRSFRASRRALVLLARRPRRAGAVAARSAG